MALDVLLVVVNLGLDRVVPVSRVLDRLASMHYQFQTTAQTKYKRIFDRVTEVAEMIQQSDISISVMLNVLVIT